jgi:hypothetical protein
MLGFPLFVPERLLGVVRELDRLDFGVEAEDAPHLY